MQIPDALQQLLRYGVLGVALNTAGYLTYLLLTRLGLVPVAVVIVLYPVMATISFLLNRIWAFSYEGKIGKNFLRYCVAHAGGLALNVALLYFLSTRLGIPHEWVQFAAIFIIAAFLFLCFRYYVYPVQSEHREAEVIHTRP